MRSGRSVLGDLRSVVARRGGRFVAVSFDSRQIRLLAAQTQRGSLRLLQAQAFDVPPGTELADPAALGQLLGQCLKQMHLSGSPLVFAVPRGQVVLKPLTLPPGTAETEMPAMVHFQVSKDLPFRVDEAVIDFAVGGHYGQDQLQQTAGIDVLVAALQLPALEYYRQLASAAGATLGHLGLSPLANLAALKRCAQTATDEHLVLVHVSAEETEIDIVVGGALAFSRSAVVRVGPPGEAALQAQAVRSLVVEVNRTIHSYQAMGPAEKVAGVMVIGGTGLEASLIDALAQGLGVPCRLLELHDAMPLPETAQSSAFLPAIGLAISYGSDRPSLDFLNVKRPVVVTDPQKKKLALAAAGAVGLLVMSAFGGGWAVHARDAQNTQLAATLSQLKSQAKPIDELSARLAAIDTWADGGRQWLDHLAQITSVVPGCEDIYVTAFNVSDDTISLTVRGYSEGALTLLNAALEEAGYKVLPGRQATVSDDRYRQEMNLKIQVPANKKIAMGELEFSPRPTDDDSLAALGANGRRTETASEIRSMPQSRGDGDGARSGRSARNANRQSSQESAPPASPAPASPSAAPSPDGYRQVTFAFIDYQAPGVQQLAATPMRLVGRVGRAGRFCLPDVTAEQYSAFGLSDPDNPRRVVYIYFPRGSDEARTWEEMLQRAAEVNARGGVTVWGRATYSREANRWSPVALVADGFSQN